MSERSHQPEDRSAAWQRHMEAGEAALRQGRVSEAEQRYADALQMAEGFGPEDARLVESLTRLGLLYAFPGRLPHGQGQAEPLLRRALAIQERRLGPDHLEVARCLVNLAQSYASPQPPRQQARMAEAQPLLEQALALLEKAEAPDLTLLHSTVNQLSHLYQRLGREAEAEAPLQRAAALWERPGTHEVGGGPGHPHAVEPLTELGKLY